MEKFFRLHSAIHLKSIFTIFTAILTYLIMKKVILYSVIFSLVYLASPKNTSAQSGELIGGNILNGAVTGTILGTATMGLQNSNHFAPLRVGLGAGILGGTGLAIYDVATLPQGQHFFISGTFNDGSNSTIIILLDTVYGAGVGAAIGSAIMLIGNKSIVKGLQYGGSAGAWAGFGFGLVDAFALAERNRDFLSDRLLNADSLFSLNRGGFNLRFLQPDLFSYHNLGGQALSTEIEPVLHAISFSKSF
jgi:hypothetical protein